MIPLRNKGKDVGMCFDTLQEAVDKCKMGMYTQVTMIVEGQTLYCCVYDIHVYRQMMRNEPVAYAFAHKEGT